jgi:hypothetical protein
LGRRNFSAGQKSCYFWRFYETGPHKVFDPLKIEKISYSHARRYPSDSRPTVPTATRPAAAQPHPTTCPHLAPPAAGLGFPGAVQWHLGEQETFSLVASI